VPSDVYPILWEAEDGGRVGFEGPHPFALILNDRPAPGLRSSYLDSISADDYSGGAMAAELLLDRGFKPRQMALLGGPQRDRRSQSRILGFLSVVRKVSVTYAESWYYEEGCRMASRVLREKPAGVFCANDRLAAAVQDVARERLGEKAPDLVGYDNAPIALVRGLTTIGIPWEEMALGAAAIACARIKGDTSPARAQIFAPRPVLRWERG
jgi:DNA-binding LacI/PurR family transcriptional regulator